MKNDEYRLYRVVKRKIREKTSVNRRKIPWLRNSRDRYDTSWIGLFLRARTSKDVLELKSTLSRGSYEERRRTMYGVYPFEKIRVKLIKSKFKI